jgi:hypothetical protein
MARKLTMNDIRVNTGGVLVAAPKWAYVPHYASNNMAYVKTSKGTTLRPVGEPRYYVQIEKLWGPLMKEICRQRADFVEAAKRQQTSWPRSMRTVLRLHQPLTSPGKKALKTCLVCEREFFALGLISTCTDKCAKARKDATRTRGKAPRPRVTHELRPCQECGEPFMPTRADALYCSGRCRVAHHRQAGNRGVCVTKLTDGKSAIPEQLG